MALVLTKQVFSVFGDKRRSKGIATFDSSYAAGGLVLTPLQLGLKAIETFLANPTSGYGFPYDFTNQKLKAMFGGPKEFSYEQPYVKGATTGSAENVDSASAPVNGNLVSTYAAFSTLVAGALLIAANPDIPRNIIISIANATGGNLNLYQGVSTFTVVGTFRGLPQTELITITSTSGNKAVGHAPDYRWKAGVKPFDTITSITVDNIGDATLTVGAGLGDRLGLPLNSATGLIADFLKYTLTGVDKAVTGLVDFTNWTFKVGTIADAVMVAIEYLIAGEVNAGTDLHTVATQYEAIGL